MEFENRTIKEISPMLTEYLGEEKGRQVLELADRCCTRLIGEHRQDPKAVRAHTEKEIFPCISLYRAMQDCGVQKEDALKFLDESWSRKAQKNADSMKKLLRVGGLYRLYPAMFRQVAKKQFGIAAGFRAKFYDCGKQHCKFDMTQCLFLDTCRNYGYPELTQCFCHTDDINNADLHPRLVWNRKRFMGNGDELCDFDIFVSQD